MHFKIKYFNSIDYGLLVVIETNQDNATLKTLQKYVLL